MMAYARPCARPCAHETRRYGNNVLRLESCPRAGKGYGPRRSEGRRAVRREYRSPGTETARVSGGASLTRTRRAVSSAADVWPAREQIVDVAHIYQCDVAPRRA